jgi:intein/homing endonuclease
VVWKNNKRDYCKMIDSDLTEEEKYLFSLLMDESGVDHMEFLWADNTSEDGLFRTWPIQMAWWRTPGQKILSAGSRSIGKSLSILGRSFSFPFVASGEEMVITAPDGDRLGAITDKVETLFLNNGVAEAMLAPGTRGRIKHRPFHISFANGARIMGRIPRLDGTGIQGSKKAGSLILTRDRGFVEVENITTDDYVWSHKNRWSKVWDVYELPEQSAFEVRGQGAIPLVVNDDHRFYVRNDVSKQPGKTKRKLGEYKWEYVNDLSESTYGGTNAYWTSPTNFGDALDVQYPNYSGCKSSYEVNEDFWWIVGRYLADGSLSVGHSQISITAPEKKEEELIKRFDSLEIKFNKRLKESGAFTFSFHNAGLVRWLVEHFDYHSHRKTMPTWVFTMRREYRQALLDGYLSGDGCAFYHGTQNRFTGSSVSKKLTLSVGTLAHTLGYHVGYGYNQPNVTEICGMELKEKPAVRYLWRLNEKGDGFSDSEQFINYKIRSVEQVEDCKFYGISVEDGSYYADGVMHHNTHPLWLEQDESSTYPERGWKEIVETVKIQNPRARWRSHGVTMGPGNTFDDKINGNDPTWIVKKLPAMYRPNWTEKERQDKIIEYGGYESLDYKRNILGSAEGADSSLLVLARLMANTDTDELSEFNMSEYYNVYVSDALLHEADDILDLVDPPIAHTEYKKVWMGMDYGLTTSLSCILVFTEVQLPGEKFGRLKLIARVMMSKIPTEQQVKVIKHLMSIYRPMAIAFDAHGVGQPAYEWLQKEVREDPTISWMLDRVKGYSFSENIIVDFDEKIDINTNIPDDWERATITRKTSDASLDILRLVVDTNKIWLPYDKELIGELQAIPRKELMTLDEYGKPRRKKGQHMLDALRFALLAWKQQPIEEVVEKYKDSWQPTSMIIMDYL